MKLIVTLVLYALSASAQTQTNSRTMLEMTFPEFEAAAAKTDVMLLPIGAIEEHGPHLPLASDALGATAQLRDVQRYLRTRGTEAIVGPPLNIGITSEAGDWTRDGTYMYPGSLTIAADTFVALYLDVLRSLKDNGMRHIFLYSGHFGGRHLQAVARIAAEASRNIDGIKVYALMDRGRMQSLDLKPGPTLLPLERGPEFTKMLIQRLSRDGQMAPASHGDGFETSEMLYFHPELVRKSYLQVPDAPALAFFDAGKNGERSRNPSGIGGFPVARASAATGKMIGDYLTHAMGEAILKTLRK